MWFVTFLLSSAAASCPAPGGRALVKATVSQLGTPGLHACASPMTGSCDAGWRPILEDGQGVPHCALTCQKSSECPGGSASSCHMGTKGLTVAQVGVCLYQTDGSTGGVVFLSLMQTPRQQQLDPHAALHGLPSQNHFAFLTGSLTQTLDALQTKRSLNGDPDMLGIRLLVAEIIKMNPNRGVVSTGGGILGNIEYGADVTIHNVLHPVEFMVNGAPGAIWDIEHPFQPRSAYILLRGLLMVLMLYLVIGAAVNAYLYQATGPALIPQIAFWLEYPQLVSDGWYFVRNKVEHAQANLNAAGSGVGGGNRDAKYLGVRDSFSNFDPLQ